jgi:UDP-glucuronate 4-epimerase
MNQVLITGAAGFVGFHLCQRLLEQGIHVVGLDNLNDYYDVGLKKARLAQLEVARHFKFQCIGLEDQPSLDRLFQQFKFDVVVNLAAQAGVRYSLENPQAYINSNLVGFANLLDACRHQQVPHLVFASSSSVYGANTKIPFSVHDNVDHPVSLYAATKKSNELMAHAYAHLYQIPMTGLRFFTVYGPWGRPDMAYFIFTKAILQGQPIKVFNHGKMQRDFTYIDDIVEGIVRVMEKIPQANLHWSGEKPDPGTSRAPFKVYNIGNNQPVELLRFIEVIEDCLGIKAQKNLLPMQPGDVPMTYADVADLALDVGFQPRTTIEAGIAKFVRWYRAYYGV